MREFNRILVPIDFSHASPILVPYAKRMAEKFHAEIHLLAVARGVEHFSSMHVSPSSIEDYQAETVRWLEQQMKEFAERHFAGQAVAKASVVAGDSAEEILKYVETESIDLVIMGTHGRKGIERAVLGSVAERVVMSSPIPVLVINPYRDRIEMLREKGKSE